MNGKKRQWPARYRQFVEARLAEEDKEFQAVLKASPRSIGGEAFRAWVNELCQKLIEGHKQREDVSFRRMTEPLSPETVLHVLARVFEVDGERFRERRRDSCLRAVAARFLMRYAGQTQREVARLLGMGTGSAVSKQMSGKSEVLTKDRRWSALVAEAERELDLAKQGKRKK
jgi:hypothetical protein